MPPSFSIAWNSLHALSQSASVRASTAPEPQAGSATKSRWLSAIMTSCVLRAIRRAKASARPWATVCGSTETELAPPTPAAKAAIVLRRMLVSGSPAVIMRYEVSAWIEAAAGGIEHSSWILAHSFRNALILAIDRNWSWSAESANPTCGAA